MKIKYKLIIIFILIIVTASLPLSLFILHEQEEEKITNLTHKGYTFSRILAESIRNIIFMNGGDIKAAKIDSKEMISILQTLREDGLVYADAILISSKKEFNGLVITGFYNLDTEKSPLYNLNRIPDEEVTRLLNQTGYREITIPGLNDIYYEFSAANASGGKKPLCLGRLIFSRSIILAPIKRLHRLIYGATISAIILAGILGLFFSRFVSNPIANLTQAAQRIEDGDFNYRLSINSKDEIGNLSNTFNQMLRIINLKIDELKRTNEKLTLLDILKDEFLANISHELRTPLYGIIGISESLINGARGKLPEETAHDLSLIVTSGKRLAYLVDDILDFSKLKNHDILINMEPVNMYDVIQLIISITRPLIEKKSLRLINNVDSDSVYVHGDENRLQQIMLNLISNAIKFTEQGEIRIDSGASEEDNRFVTFTISDTGIGIKPEDRERIFESFEQIDGSDTRRYGGTGLGLAITRKLIELHGGTIHVESEPGRGSSFIFTLERCLDHEIKRKKKETEESQKELFDVSYSDIQRSAIEKNYSDIEAKKTILIVDDDPVNLQVLINHLTLEGYFVIEATNDQEVFRILDGFLPDIILLDVMLPRVSGYDICKRIREKHSSHDLPVIMLTAKNKPGDMVTGLNSGANDYLTKPINRDELLARVRSLISMKDSVQMQNELNLIKYQLDVARKVQKAILPDNPPSTKNITLVSRYESTKEIGGDFYNYQIVDDYHFGIFIADVSGHGVPAAIISSMLEVAFSFFKKNEYDNPALLFKNVNNKMGDYSHGFYLTACYAYFDLKQMKIYHANAGHQPLLIWRKGERQLIQDKIYDRPIGMFPEADYSVNEIELKNHDRIIFYTDGLIEARGEGGEIFGTENFYSLIKEVSDLNAGVFADRILEYVKKWADVKHGETLHDDATLIVVDITLPDDDLETG